MVHLNLIQNVFIYKIYYMVHLNPHTKMCLYAKFYYRVHLNLTFTMCFPSKYKKVYLRGCPNLIQNVCLCIIFLFIACVMLTFTDFF